MANTNLHLDADTSIKALLSALQDRGHDVTRTPNAWMPPDASDERQLLGATAQGRVIFTFNVSDFMALAKTFPDHHGILLAIQQRWLLAELISALDRMLTETQSEDWIGQVRWLNDWRLEG